MKSKQKKILVIGAGAWGTSIASLVARNFHQVFLSSNSAKIVAEINQQNTNQNFLPGTKLSPTIKAVENFFEHPAIEFSSLDVVFIVVPSRSINSVFDKISSIKFSRKCKFVICSKGFEDQSLALISDAFEKITKRKKYAILSGPNFALEVANEFPTITTVAAKSKSLGKEIIEILNNDFFKAQYFSDPRTIEICGIVKNIIAIGCGIVDGLGLGVNAKAALVMKGISEIRLLCKKFKASQDITHAAGFGDIFLTCSSAKSRNNLLGTMIAKGKTYEEVLRETKKTYEGATSAQSLSFVARRFQIRLEVCETINEIIFHRLTSKQIAKRMIAAILHQ